MYREVVAKNKRIPMEQREADKARQLFVEPYNMLTHMTPAAFSL